MSEKERLEGRRLINKSLKNADDLIRAGCEPGNWPGMCPIANQCPNDVGKRTAWKKSRRILILAFIVIVAGGMMPKIVGSLGKDGVKDEGARGGYSVVQDPVSGERVAISEGDHEAAADGFVTSFSKKPAPVSAVCWRLNDSWIFRVRREAWADSVIVSNAPESPASNPSEELHRLLRESGGQMEDALINGAIPPFSEEEAEVDGTTFLFKKWMFQAPQGSVQFWYGLPTHQR